MNSGREEVECIRKVLGFVGDYVNGCGPRVRRLCLEHLAQQFTIDGVMALQHPNRFASEPIVIGIVLVQMGNPLFHCGSDNFSRPIAQLATRTVARSRLVLAKLVEQLGLTLPVLRHRLEQVFLGVNKPINSPPLMIAIRIALRVLHVTDERVAPITEPERAVRADLRIDRPEVLVVAYEQIIGDFGSCAATVSAFHHAVTSEACGVVVDFESRNAVHVDYACINELALYVIWELTGVEKVASDAWSHTLIVEHGIHSAPAGNFGPGKRRIPMLLRGRAVANKALAPFIEHVAPWVTVTRRVEMPELERARVDHVCTGSIFTPKRAPRRFYRGAHRDSFERVQKTAVRKLALAHRVVRVVARSAVEELDNYIGFVVAVGVLQPEHPRLIGNEHATVPELKARRAVELVVKYFALVGAAVVIRVFEDQQPIARPRVARLPLRVCRHATHPEAPAIVEADLIGFSQLGELALACERLHFKTDRHLHRFGTLFRREIL